MGVVRCVEELDNTDYAFPDAYETWLLHGADSIRDFDRGRERTELWQDSPSHSALTRRG